MLYIYLSKSNFTIYCIYYTQYTNNLTEADLVFSMLIATPSLTSLYNDYYR